jgi:aconitate hydratase
MVTIASTAAMATRIYETMTDSLEIIRTRLGKPLTLADKILLGHLAEPQIQALEPDSSYLFL